MGDLNARTKLGDDYVRDGNDEHSPINTRCYNKDEDISRKNMDMTPIDQQGKKILQLCKSSSCRILNGRVNGDKTGKVTRYPSKFGDNPSLIDYALCSAFLMNHIYSFSVLPFTGLSDHCCISLCLKLKDSDHEHENEKEPTPIQECKLHETDMQFTYNSKRRDIFIQNVLRDNNLTKLTNLTFTNMEEITMDRIDNAISVLNNILLSAALKSFPTKRRQKNAAKSKKKGNNWFDRECMKYKKKFRNACKLMSKCPFDKTLRTKFLESRAAYKKICRKAEKESRRRLTKQLIELGQGDPKTFWNIIDKMNK